jgi:hypothetical protein
MCDLDWPSYVHSWVHVCTSIYMCVSVCVCVSLSLRVALSLFVSLSVCGGLWAELWEEAGVRATALLPRGRLDFAFEGDPVLLEVHVYECGALAPDAATPTESEEMRPAWFAADALPYDEMWADDRLWLPSVLAGRPVHAHFLFRGHETILAHRALTPHELSSGARRTRFGPEPPDDPLSPHRC